jgi:hypothetical protein
MATKTKGLIMDDKKNKQIMFDALGIHPDDLDDGGDMVNELNDIYNLNSHLYDDITPAKSYSNAVKKLKKGIK